MAHPEKTKMLSSAYSYSSQKQPLMPILLLRSILRLRSSSAARQLFILFLFKIQYSNYICVVLLLIYARESSSTYT